MSYEPVDAKLARSEAKVGHVLQLCFYAEAIAATAAAGSRSNGGDSTCNEQTKSIVSVAQLFHVTNRVRATLTLGEHNVRKAHFGKPRLRPIFAAYVVNGLNVPVPVAPLRVNSKSPNDCRMSATPASMLMREFTTNAMPPPAP